MYNVIRLLVDFRDESRVIGYIVSFGGKYSVGVSRQKAEELGIKDLDLMIYYDIPKESVVPIRGSKYAMVDRSMGYFEEFADVPVDEIGDKKVYYGHILDDMYIVPLDSEYALKRMKLESENKYVE